MKVGILGGGQLGRMLLQAAANYDLTTYVLEKDPNCPAAHLCHHFSVGDILDYDTVYQFGKQLDALTIEIEAVNVDALTQLEKEGVKIYPTPAAIRTIKNKIAQKQFYADNEIPSSNFVITHTAQEIQQHVDLLPAVHKLAEGGYDGKGVQVIENEKSIALGFNAPAVLEEKVNIVKELALIVGMNAKGETVIFPPAEMIFDQVYNLLDYQLSPAKIEEKQLWRAEAIARKVVQSLKSPGLFAIELFVDQNNTDPLYLESRVKNYNPFAVKLLEEKSHLLSVTALHMNNSAESIDLVFKNRFSIGNEVISRLNSTILDTYLPKLRSHELYLRSLSKNP
ncbi:MAG: hypothetical protein RIQ51_1437 [Bacteroidota bacterium]